MPDAGNGPPACGSHKNGLVTFIPGPGQDGYDATLAAAARVHDRQFHAINAYATGLAAEFTTTDAGAVEIAAFLSGSDSVEFAETTGHRPESLGVWSKSAGLYGGAGIAADAFRYAVLRDEGEDCAEVATARAQLILGLEALDTAARIPGVPGVMARSLLRTDLPAAMPLDTTPLFDDGGMPLPAMKNNGTWRADNSGGRYPNLIWEDSLSRDMLVGWAMAFGVSFEVIDGDSGFSADLKSRLREDAKQVGLALKKVGAQGYDLEIPDADGRVTYNGYLNENALDRGYIPGVDNGVYALMSMGIIGALAKASGDASLSSYLSDTLVTQRRLDRIADTNAHLVDMGIGTNYSNTNMAFTGGFLAQRYVSDDTAGKLIRRAIRDELYFRPDNPARQVKETKQTLFDLIEAEAELPDNAMFDDAAVAQGVDTLNGYPAAPFWNLPRTNCDASEVSSGSCTLDDGTTVTLTMAGTDVVADQPIPIKVRPVSNYDWRSNPYEPNDSSPGDGLTLESGVDFRVAYWMGRWLRR